MYNLQSQTDWLIQLDVICIFVGHPAVPDGDKQYNLLLSYSRVVFNDMQFSFKRSLAALGKDFSACLQNVTLIYILMWWGSVKGLVANPYEAIKLGSPRFLTTWELVRMAMLLFTWHYKERGISMTILSNCFPFPHQPLEIIGCDPGSVNPVQSLHYNATITCLAGIFKTFIFQNNAASFLHSPFAAQTSCTAVQASLKEFGFYLVN